MRIYSASGAIRNPGGVSYSAERKRSRYSGLEVAFDFRSHQKLSPQFKFFDLFSLTGFADDSLGPPVALALWFFKILGLLSLGQYAGLLNLTRKAPQ